MKNEVMKMNLNGNSPLSKTEVNQMTAPITDKRTLRKQVEAVEARETAKTGVELEHARKMNDLKLRKEQIEVTELEQAANNRIQAENKKARREATDETIKRLKTKTPGVVRTSLATMVIASPMAVAWTSQTGFANKTLGWPGPAGIVFAAAWEASTAFCGWMYHEARKDGDRGTPYKAATWLFALGAGLMNYWHNMPANAITGTPTAKAVSYGIMSITGITLWELYTRLQHRKHLRSKGVLSEARPSFGLLRWVRFPAVTWNAWSATVKSQKTMTLDDAWKAGQTETFGLDRRPEVKVTVVREVAAPVMTLPKAKVRLVWTDPDGVEKTTSNSQDKPVLTERSRRFPQLETSKNTTDHDKTDVRSTPTPKRKTERQETAKTTHDETDAEIKTGIVVKNKPTDEDRDRAIALYIESVQKGETITKVALAEKTGFSKSWAYTQILAARAIIETETE
jgi:hypothetical protein